MMNFRVTESEVFCNTKIKFYPDGEKKITVASRNVFKKGGFELAKGFEIVPKPKNMNNTSRDDSVRRAKDKVHDIVRMNGFTLFATLTFDGEKVDRANKEEIQKKVKNFFDNLVRRYDVKYVLVPEYHKKNNAIHFHVFMSGNVKLEDSGTVKAKGFDKPIKIETAKKKGIPLEECQTVYNLPQWKIGFSTAIISDGNNSATAKYITKYITKDAQKIFGKFYFAGGKDLVREVPYDLTNTDYATFQADKEVYCYATDTYFKYLDTANSRGVEYDL